MAPMALWTRTHRRFALRPSVRAGLVRLESTEEYRRWFWARWGLWSFTWWRPGRRSTKSR
jgi:hypothetical protein